MPTLKLGTILPTPEEDKEIREAVAADPDTKLLEDPNIKLVSFNELKKKKKMGRPTKADPKVDIHIRLRSDVVEKFKASGPKWQTRMNEALADWLKHNSPEDIKL
ncbi:BrnA antitoxin family protein [Yersinia alsatica]|uniref:BrnA antitoxin family protein n=1 Tax=Yersinia alsatica TaxID=2890317 RepID=UPI0005DC71F3|nr:BrnA antitoxin family protein [Yersinia alsatica]OWF79572.1 hypothetical protein B4903_10750 [Yersinia frederiksenii]CNI88731.1 Uncharacterized protein conserved in bacteria [Yersinia frederiksenii]